MNKNWLTLIVIAIITTIIYMGYQFYFSLSGANITFDKTIEPIEPDLGRNVLDAVMELDSGMPVRDEALNNK